MQTRAFQMQPQLLFIWILSFHNKPFQEVKVDGFVALQGGRRRLLVQTLLHFKVKLHFYILAPLAPCYFCQVFCSNYLSIYKWKPGWQKLAGFLRTQKIPSILSSGAYLVIHCKK